MYDEKQLLALGVTNNRMARLIDRVGIDDPQEGVKENFTRQLEWDSMLQLIRGCFGGVPFKRGTAQAVMYRSNHSVLTKAIRGKSHTRVGFQPRAWPQSELRAGRISA